MEVDTVRVYSVQSDIGVSYGHAEFTVHDHVVDLPEDIANDVVFGMPTLFGFAPWPDDVKEKTEYSIPEGYEQSEDSFAITNAERDAFLVEVEKHTAELAAGVAEEVEVTDSPVGRNRPTR